VARTQHKAQDERQHAKELEREADLALSIDTSGDFLIA
jgi:hypothetical protein